MQCPVHGFLYKRASFVQSEMVQQHGSGEDGTQRVGNVFPGRLRIGTVDGFKKCCSFTDRRGGQQSEGTADHAGFIADNIAEHIFGQHHIKLFRVEDDLHGCIIDKQEIDCHIGE